MKKVLSLALALVMCLGLTVPALGAEIPHDVDTRTVPVTWRNWGDPLPDDSALTIRGVIGQSTFEGTALFDVVAGGGYTLDMSFPAGRGRFYATYMNNVVEDRKIDEFNEALFDQWTANAPVSVFDNSNATSQYVYTCTEDMVGTPGHELLFHYWLDWDDAPIGAEHSENDGNVEFWLCVHPAEDAGVQAMPTNDKLTADGEVQNPTVYKIGDSNYFKIRDLAAILNGTEKQFSVGYDDTLKSVTATTGEGYDKLSTDLVGAAAGNQTAEVSNDTIYVNGQKVEAEVYKIDGSNYFKLRDLGKALNFYVGWTQEQGMFIETDKPYTE